MSEIFLSENARATKSLDDQVLELWIIFADKTMLATRERLDAFMALQGYPHASAYIADGSRTAYSFAGCWQTTSLVDVIPSGIIIPFMEHYLADVGTAVVTNSGYYADLLNKRGLAGRAVSYEDVLKDDFTFHRPGVKTLIYHDSVDMSSFDPGEEKKLLWDVEQKLFPPKALDATHIDVIRLR